jgi:hypothetical protein
MTRSAGDPARQAHRLAWPRAFGVALVLGLVGVGACTSAGVASGQIDSTLPPGSLARGPEPGGGVEWVGAPRETQVDRSRLYPASPRPDRVSLTWSHDPSTSQTVSWRTDSSVVRGLAQILADDGRPPIVEGDSLDFDLADEFEPFTAADDGGSVREVSAEARPLEWSGVVDHYHSAVFEDLEPDTRYLYRVGDGREWSEWYAFRTAALDPEPFRFLYFGDAQNNTRGTFSRTIREAFRHAPDARFTLHAGDLALSSGADYSWGEWFEAGGFHLASIPTLPSTGNSDHQRLETGGLDTRMLYPQWSASFALPRNGPRDMEDVAWYLDIQGVRFISLYSNFESVRPGERRILLDRNREVTPEMVAGQTQWLEEALSDNPMAWTVVFFHHPVHSVREDRERDELRDLWEPLFREHGVDLVLQGHDHAYGRGAPDQPFSEPLSTRVGASRSTHLPSSSDPDAGETGPESGGWEEAVYRAGEGPVYMVSNAGGKARPLDRTGTALWWTERVGENLQLFQIIDVQEDLLRVEAWSADGRLFDAFEIRR